LPPPPFHGIIPPTITPLTAAGTVDVASLERLTQRLVDAGVHGLFVLGSSGEGASLEPNARRLVVERTVAVADGRVPTIVGCLVPTTDHVIACARAAEAAGADAVVVTSPYYVRVATTEMLEHFRAVRGAIDLPILAYEVPVATQHSLSLELLDALAQEGIIAGVKDSSLDDVRLRRLLLQRRTDAPVSVLTGHECFVDGALLAGADGAVPGLANVDPDGYVRLWQASQDGDWVRARKEQERLVRLMEITAAAGPAAGPSSAGLGGFKTALQLMGVIDHNLMTPPLHTLDGEERARVHEVLVATGLLS
jgi:4-hydroxy-tetrahydrodipicolinate synthase